MSVARAVEERVVVPVVVVMMVVIPIMVIVPRVSPRTVPRVVPSCPIRRPVPSAIPVGVVNPRVIESSAVEPRIVPSGVICRAVYSPIISVRSPRIAVVAHERVDVDCRDVGVLEVEREGLRCLRESCLCGCCAVTRVEHCSFCQFRQRIRFLLALCEIRCGESLFRPRVIYSVILTDSLCRSSTGRHHDAAYRQRHDSRHS